MEGESLNHNESLEIEHMLTNILDHMEVIDSTIENKRLDGACLELLKQVVEAGDRWHLIWEENYCE